MQLYTFSTHKVTKYKIDECGKMCERNWMLILAFLNYRFEWIMKIIDNSLLILHLIPLHECRVNELMDVKLMNV